MVTLATHSEPLLAAIGVGAILLTLLITAIKKGPPAWVLLGVLFCCGCGEQRPITVIDNSLYVKELERANKSMGETIERLTKEINECRTPTQEALAPDPEPTAFQTPDECERSLLMQKPPEPPPQGSENDPEWQGSIEERDGKVYLIPAPAAQRLNAKRRAEGR